MEIKCLPHMTADIPALIDIAAQVFGRGYAGPELFEDTNGGVVVASHDWTPVGFAVHRRLADSDLHAIERAGIRLPDEILRRHALGRLRELKSLAVTPALQRRGIGTILMDYAMETMRSRGQDACVVPAWKSGSHVNIDPLLRRHGFAVAGELRDIWTRSCDAADFACPARRPAAACACSALVYYTING